MSLHRFFIEDSVLPQAVDGVFVARLAEDDIRHMKAVRLKHGELVAVIDGDSDFFQCEVLEVLKDGFRARISSTEEEGGDPFEIHLFQGIAKGQKMEDVVRHATEVGVSAFFPLDCSRCVSKYDSKRSASKVERLRRVAKSASMQAGRREIPRVGDPVDVSQACGMLDDYDSIVVFWEEAEGSCLLADALARSLKAIDAGESPKVAVFVGPEGGFDEDEVNAVLSASDAASISTLGHYILRTETAGVVGCALVSYVLGGMGAKGHDVQDGEKAGM